MPSSRFRFNSIIRRIVFLHVIAVGIICVVMPLLLYWMLARETASLHRVTMREHAELLATSLKRNPDGTWALDLPANVSQLYSEKYGRFAYAVIDNSGKTVLSSLRDPGPIFPVTETEPGITQLQRTRGDAVYSGISLNEDVRGEPVTVQVAENLRHHDVIIDDIVANFLVRVGWITLPILIALLVFDILVVRRALRPLMRASREAQLIGPLKTDIRLPTHGLPAEVAILVKAINQALDRLEHGYHAQREFVADVAHELRTPLTILRTRVDTSKETSISGAVRQDVDRMSRVVNQLLEMAELDTSDIETSELINLQNVCAEVVEYIAPLALREGKEIALNSCAEPVWVQGNQEMLFRALRNLTENAIGHTPKGSTVEIVLEPDATISVTDEGPGIRTEDSELIFRRFWRGDRRRLGNVGLGLSIVDRIVTAHGGMVTASNRPQGGASFTIKLPLVPDTQAGPSAGEDEFSRRAAQAANGLD